MKKTLFLDQYPIHSLTLMKEDARHKTMAQMIDYFKEKINAHPVAQFIAIFDHYAHTKSLNGEIMEGLKDVQNVIFCLEVPFQVQNSRTTSTKHWYLRV